MKETKEGLYREWAEYNNEIERLNGREPADIETMVCKWRAHYMNKESLSVLRERRDACRKALDRCRAQKAKEAKIEAFKATPEGREFFDAHKSRLDALYTTCDRERMRLEDGIRVAVRLVMGNHWNVELLTGRKRADAVIREVVDGKDVFGTEFRLTLDMGPMYRGAHFMSNIGSTGSFDVMEKTPGSRAEFYMAVGSLLSAKTTLDAVRELMLRAVEMSEKYMNEIEYERKLLDNPFQG